MKHIIKFRNSCLFSWQLVSAIEPIKRPLLHQTILKRSTLNRWHLRSSERRKSFFVVALLVSLACCGSGNPMFRIFPWLLLSFKPACIIEIVSDTWWLSWHVTFPLHWSDGQLDTAGFQDCLKLQGPWRRTCDRGRSADKFKRLIMVNPKGVLSNDIERACMNMFRNDIISGNSTPFFSCWQTCFNGCRMTSTRNSTSHVVSHARVQSAQAELKGMRSACMVIFNGQRTTMT